MARRWVSEGFIRSKATTGDVTERATDEADRDMNALATRGFVGPTEISTGGDFKRCKVHDEVYEVVARILRDSRFVNMDLQPE